MLIFKSIKTDFIVKMITLILYLLASSINNYLYAEIDDAQVHFNKGLFYQMGILREPMVNLSTSSNFYKVINEFQYVIDNYPSSRWAASSQNNIAWLYFNIKDFDKAVDELKKIIANYNDSDFADDAQYQLGYIHFLEKEYNEAITNFQKTIDYYSSKKVLLQKDRVPFAYFMIAECKVKQGKINEAIAIYQKIINDYPHHSKARESKMRLKQLSE